MVTPGNPRMIPLWLQNQLCSYRLAAYKNELRGDSKLEQNDLDLLGPVDRPYGIPWEWQGAVEDVWGSIFEHVDDPQDIISLCEASDLFRWMLRRKYVEARFPHVLDVCFRHNLDYFRIPETEWQFFTNDMFRGYTAGKLRLEGRLLSKLTKRSMEEHLYKKIREKWEDHIFSIPSIQVTEDANVNYLLREMEDANVQNDGSFYPTTFIVYDRLFRFDDLQAKVSELLGKIGLSIRKLHFYSERDPEVTYNCIRRWTGLTPNLEELEIHVTGYLRRPSPVDFCFDDVEVLEFPVLSKLRTYLDDPTTPVRCREAVLRANPRVRILRQERKDYKSASPVNNVFLSIERLQDLQLEEWKCISVLPQNLFQSRFNWPLKRLTIIDFKGREEDKISSQALFGFVNTFQTLEHLHLELPVEDDGENLELPNLRKLRWRIQQKFELMDFILPLEKLERLHVFIGDYLATRLGITDSRYIFTQEEIQTPREEVLQFFQGLRVENFQETNLKTFFPRLREIKISSSIRFDCAQTFSF